MAFPYPALLYFPRVSTALQTPNTPLARRRALLLAVLCPAIGLLALALLRPAVAVLTEYRPPVTPPLSPGLSGTAITERVVLVVLSGVGTSALEQGGDPWRFVQLRRRAAEGAHGVIRAVQPSGDAPTWATLLTGAEPAITGIVDAEEVAPLPLSTLFDHARSARMRTAVVASRAGWQWRSQLSAPDEIQLAPSSAAVADAAAAFLGSPGISLAVVLVDMGRVFAIRPAERWARLDAQVAIIAGVLDPSRDTLIITSDHGMLPDGSNGGGESTLVNLPLVLWGRGIMPGRLPIGRQQDLAPTISTLLGLPYAPFGGRPWLDVLRLEPAEQARELARLLQARAAGVTEANQARVTERVAAAQAALDREDWRRAADEALQGLAALDAAPGAASSWTADWLWGGVVPVALVVLAWLLPRLPRKQRLLIPLVGQEVYLLAWAAIYFGLAGKPLSLSALYGNWNANLLNVAVWGAMALAAMAVGLGLYRPQAGAWAAAERTGWATLFVLGSLAAFVLIYLLIAGLPSGRLPSFTGWAAVLLALAQLAGAGLAAPLALVLSAMITEVVNRGR